MDVKDVLIEGYGRIPQLLGMALDGLTAEQLAYRPTEQANSIAWLAWHLTRVQDKQVCDLAGYLRGGMEDRHGYPACVRGRGWARRSESTAGPGGRAGVARERAFHAEEDSHGADSTGRAAERRPQPRGGDRAESALGAGG